MAIDAFQIQGAVAVDTTKAENSLNRFGRTVTGQFVRSVQNGLMKAAMSASQNVERLTSRVEAQQRLLPILSQELSQLSQKYGASSTQVQRKQLAIDNLNRSIQASTTQITRYKAASDRYRAALEAEQQAADQAAVASSHLAESSGALSGRLSGVATAAAGVAAALGAALVAGLGAAAFSGLQLNNNMEQVSAKLMAFTKDGATTARILEDIRNEAAKTPFAFDEMANAATSLLPAAKASGEQLMDLIKTAEILAALNPAEGLTGASFAIKEALSGDLTSIIERFNLSRAALNKFKEDGVVTLEEINQALRDIGADESLITNLANTMQGRWSTIKDTLQGLAATATKPLFDVLSSSLARFQTVLDANLPRLEEFAQTIGEKLAGAVQWAIDNIPRIIGVFQSLGEAARVLMTGDFRGGIFGLSEDSPIVATLLAISNLALRLGDAFRLAGDKAAPLVAQLSTIATQLGGLTPVVEVLAGVVGGALSLAFEIVTNLLSRLDDAVLIAVQGVSGAIGNLGTILGGLGTMVQGIVNGDWAQAWEGAKRVFDGFVGLLSPQV